MMKRVGFVVACAAALAVCSCAPQAELDKARADAAAARAETEKLRAEVDELKAKEAEREKVKADAAKAKADAEAAREKAAALEEEMRKRWNVVGPTVTLPGWGDFRWTGPNAFPHPTFKGGSKEAYTAFARALVTFLETGDNFEFMRKNDLFTADIGFGGTGKIKIVEFAESLAKPGSLGAGDEDNRKKLEALVAKMKAPRKA